MPEYFTSGQVARKLRISVSTLKRWIIQGEAIEKETRNASGWMLFSEIDMEDLHRFKKYKRRNGKSFSKETLSPIE